MFIPISTDAPIYHLPFATAGTIVVNLLMFLPLAFAEPDDTLPVYSLLILQYGYILPWQWVTSNYIHADWLHLIGNMYFLWTFGLIIEGKIGWWRFLLLYNAIGIIECAFEQTCGLALGKGASLGASSIIYGLIAVAVVWAPQNELHCFATWRFSMELIDLNISTFALISFFYQVGVSFFVAANVTMGKEVRFTSEVLHTMGGAVGLLAGVFMLKTKMVDCESWDIFSIWSGDHMRTQAEEKIDVAAELEKIKNSERAKYKQATDSGPTYAEPTAYAQPARPASSRGTTGGSTGGSTAAPTKTAKPASNTAAEMLAEFRHQLENNQPLAAFATHQRTIANFPGWGVTEPEYVNMMRQMRMLQVTEPLIPVMLGYLRRYREQTVMVRLALTHLLLQLRRPRQAFVVLNKLTGAKLDQNQQHSFQQLRASITQQTTQVLNEPSAQDW